MGRSWEPHSEPQGKKVLKDRSDRRAYREIQGCQDSKEWRACLVSEAIKVSRVRLACRESQANQGRPG